MYIVFVENRQYIVIFYVKIVTASDIYEYLCILFYRIYRFIKRASIDIRRSLRVLS